jgi:type IV pilus assembly protein PilY1
MKIKKLFCVIAIINLVGLMMVSDQALTTQSECLFQDSTGGAYYSFAAPVVPPGKSYSNNEIYFSFFGPKENYWEGNVVKFRLSEQGEIAGSGGSAVALYPGFASDPSSTAWIIDDSANPIWETKNWTVPGTENHVPDRNLLTFLGLSSSGVMAEFSAENNDLTPAILGNPTDRSRLIEVVKTIVGGTLHGEPLIVDYGPSMRVVYFGANDGVLHAVDDADGKEMWGFIPPDHLHRLKEIVEGSEPPYFIDSSPKAYIVDVNGNGVIERSEGDTIILVCGEGKGGRSYFALDVTVPNEPIFLWRISNENDSRAGVLQMEGMSGHFFEGEMIQVEGSGGIATVSERIGELSVRYGGRTGVFQIGDTVTGQDSGVSGTVAAVSHYAPPDAGPVTIIPELGQTWAEPQLGRVKTSDNDTLGTPVLFVGGGYSSDHSAGKTVLAINVLTGQVLREFKGLAGMDFCIPSAVTAVDSDGNGFIDKVYVGDLGGQVWRFGRFSDSAGNPLTFPKTNENIMSWTGEVIFRAGESSEKRMFYYPPSVVLERGYDLLFMGTGDREDACNRVSSDRIYCIRDDHVPATLTEQDLVDVLTPVLLPDGSEVLPVPKLKDESADVDGNDFPDKGWYIRLTPGEKVLRKGLVFHRVLYVSTFKPIESGGEGRLYALDYETGQPVLFLDNEGNRVRSRWIGGSIPSRPVMVIGPSGVRLLASTGRISDLEGSVGSGILALNPVFPPLNFFHLWWKDL